MWYYSNYKHTTIYIMTFLSYVILCLLHGPFGNLNREWTYISLFYMLDPNILKTKVDFQSNKFSNQYPPSFYSNNLVKHCILIFYSMIEIELKICVIFHMKFFLCKIWKFLKL
jgi:hypothetical protein